MSDTRLTTKPVLVTGATGYVAGELIKALLEFGLTVHACVRDPHTPGKIQHLLDMATDKPGTLHFFKTDLLEEGSYTDAMDGCEWVFHTASPFSTVVDDPQRDLVDPAVKGTENVLHSVNQTDSVKRVIVTSSVAAIYSDNIDCENKPGKTLTEAHWNTYADLTHNPYHYSKVAAEKAAWAMAEQQERWQLITINPSLVVGPALNPHATSDSFTLLRQFADGSMKAGVPDCGIGLVDVKDVAQAHIQAALRPDARGRYIINGENSSLLEIADMLRPRFGSQYPLPRKTLPKFLVWLFAPLAGTSRTFVKRNVGYPFKADNGKGINELALEYHDVASALNAMFEQMQANHLLD